MSLAITYAANTLVPVTWTTQAGTTATAHMPTHLHMAYAADTHTTTVVTLADQPNSTTIVPGTTVEQGPSGGVIGSLGGATLVGIVLLVWAFAKWRHSWAKEAKQAFVMGAAAAVLIGSWGLLGTFTSTVRGTGDSVGNSISTTIGQTSLNR